jgi:GT2 family glycosyltransferase
VIVAFHSGSALVRCVQSIEADAGGELEIIVVDNGGGGREIEQVAALERVRVVGAGQNLGYAGGCNRGAREAMGEVIIFLNPDTVTEPGAVRALAAVLQDREIGIATARLRLLDQPDRLNSYGTVMHLSGIAWAGGHGEDAETLDEQRIAPLPSGAAMAVRADVFRALGEFTEELFMYYEDAELGWRSWLHGLRVVATPAADVFHDYEFSRNPGKQYLLDRNRLIVVFTGYPIRLLLVLTPILASAELGLLVVALKDGWAGEKLRSWGWCLRRLRWLARHRRETQRLKRVSTRELAHVLTPIIDPQVVEVPGVLSVANALMSGYWKVARRLL